MQVDVHSWELAASRTIDLERKLWTRRAAALPASTRSCYKVTMRPLIKFLLLLAFVAGQFCALAHAAEHELTPDSTPSCETCALAHSGMASATSLALPTTPIPDSLVADATRPIQPSLRVTARPRSRAPPSFTN